MIKKIVDFIKKHKIYLFFLCLSLLLLFFCSKNSPFYAFNEWMDANIYFTMGKGIFNNKVLYKDLFDHKGPLIFFIYGIGYLISNTSFIGIYFIESICLSITLLFVYKNLRLFYNHKTALVLSLLFPMFSLNNKLYVQGGAPEEFILCAQVISLYYFLSYFINKTIVPTRKEMFIHGVMTSFALLIKFNLITFWFFFLLFILIKMIKNKQYKDIVYSLLYYILGILILVLPIIIYFVLNNALYDFYYSYFKFNSIYGGMSISFKLLNTMTWKFKELKSYNNTSFILMVFGLFIFNLKNKKLDLFGKLALTLSALFIYFSIYGSVMTFKYSYQTLIVFIIISIIVVFDYFKDDLYKYKFNTLHFGFYVVFFFILTFYYNNNFIYSKMFKVNYVQNTFCEIINSSDNKTLLNYRFLDGGFYTKCNIVPTVKYFHYPNIDKKKYSLISDMQDSYVKQGLINFVVIRVPVSDVQLNLDHIYKNSDYALLTNNYSIRKYYDEYVEGITYRYFLFQLKSSN